MKRKYKVTIEPIFETEAQSQSLPFPKYMYCIRNNRIVWFSRAEYGVQINSIVATENEGDFRNHPHEFNSWNMDYFIDCPDQSNPFNLKSKELIPFPKFMRGVNGCIVLFKKEGHGIQINNAFGEAPHEYKGWNMDSFSDIIDTKTFEL